ncbi:MAG TPA: ABC transporter substrate-binding protein [Streptosporangiaceae bacterium]|nr:ABC transporter substrate-binding protein [Streptosporangiaceae bacterium]
MRTRSNPLLAPHVRISVTLAAALALLAACSSGTSGAGSGSGSGTITFGVLHPFTGAYASVGEAALQGVTVAMTEINAAGGILGRKLQIVHADTLGDPVDAVPAAEHMIASSHPVGIIGPGGLEIGSVQRVLDDNRIPFEFEGGDTAFDNTTDPMLWRDSPSDLQEGVAMALYALQQGYKRAAFMMSSITTAQDFIPYIQGAYKAGGGTIVANETMTPGLTSYRSEVLKVVQAKPQVIFSQIEPPTAAVMTQDFKEIDNLAIPIVASDTSAAAEWIKAVTPSVAHKAIVSCEGATATSPATPVFLKYFKQDYHGQQPLASATYAYDATIALALAIDKAGSTSGPTYAKDIPLVTTAPGTVVYDYKTALADVKAGKDINYDGASGNMDYNQFHNVFGPYQLVKSDLSGVEQVVGTISAAQLEKGTPKGA